MPDERTELAVEAAARAFHENAREKRQFQWEQSSEEWRLDIRAFVRPMVEAALLASEVFWQPQFPRSKARRHWVTEASIHPRNCCPVAR